MTPPPQLLSEEVSKIIADRAATYGEPLEHFTKLAAIWTAMLENHYRIKLDHPLPPRMAAMFMVALKMLRATSSPHPDSHVDLAAFNQFAALFAHAEPIRL